MRALAPLALPIVLAACGGGCALALLYRGSSLLASPVVLVPAASAAGRESPAPRDVERARLDEAARAPAVDVRIAPSSNGVLGAWLVAGPFKAARSALAQAPSGVDERTLTPTNDAVLGTERELHRKRRPPARWKILSSGPGQDPGSSGSRTIDLKTNLEDSSGSDLVAYAGGRLHVEKPGRYYLLLGVDDGVRVTVDGA